MNLQAKKVYCKLCSDMKQIWSRTFKPSSFLLLNAANSLDQLESVEIFHYYVPLSIVWISIEITCFFFQWKICWTTINVTAPLLNFASQVILSYFKDFYIYFNWIARFEIDSFTQDDSPKHTDSFRNQTSHCLFEWVIDSFTVLFKNIDSFRD